MKQLLRNMFILVAVIVLAPIHSAAGEIEATDFRGKKISIHAPARRIVCLIESALSGIYMLGAEEVVVGISTNIYGSHVMGYYAALDKRIVQKQLPTPGNWDFVNIESVISLSPDLVIIWSHQEESIAALEDKGLPVYGVFIRTFDDIYKEIMDLGVLTGKTSRAQFLVSQTRLEMENFSQQIKHVSQPLPRVYFMWSQGMLETSGKNSSANDLIHLAGGENVCGHIEQEHIVVNMENVLAWNPEVIVMWHNLSRNSDDVINDPLWKSVSAVKNLRVHELPNPFMCDFWTLKFQFAVKAVAKWCHPEALSELNLDAESRKMIQILYGRDIK
jgi:iron complex transport system substrate-binding protein